MPTPPPMLRHATVALALFALAAGPRAQKPFDTAALERGADPLRTETLPAETGAVHLRTGHAAALYREDFPVRAAAPEAMAREYLGARAAMLGLENAADLVLAHVRESRAGTTVRFDQTIHGLPVWGADVVVNIDPARRVQFVLNDYRPGLEVNRTMPLVTPAAARAAALAHLGADGPLHYDRLALLVWPAESGARLAWQVRAEPAGEPRGDWEVIVDAETGALLRVANRLLTHRRHAHDPADASPARLPVVESHPLFRVDASAFVFHPDPLTRAGATYTTPGYADNNDQNSPQLQAARAEVTLRDVSPEGSGFILRGPWAHIIDHDAPFKGLFVQPNAKWEFTRDNDAFEAATAYFHIDAFMRYVNEELGVAVRPRQYTTGVQFDPSGWNGADNSSFSPGTGRLSFGEGGVDDAEDADVIIHELGHGLHDWLTNGRLSQVNGLSEGVGDYLAASYTRRLGLLSPSDPAYHWTFKWDGHNPFWPGRVVNYSRAYPGGLVGQIHTDGQIWATTMMEIWDDIGAAQADRAFLEGLALTTNTTNQQQAAQAVLQAAANMSYPQAQLDAMLARFTARGYAVAMPTAGENAPDVLRPQGFALSEPAPNPFNGYTTFELVVDRAQRVSVEAFDLLGRRVAELFEGDLLMGKRYPFALEAAGLRAGVYIVRVQGETFAASRRATLVR